MYVPVDADGFIDFKVEKQYSSLINSMRVS